MTRAFTIQYSDVQRCPTKRLDVGHYLEDGRCHCNVPELAWLAKGSAKTKIRAISAAADKIDGFHECGEPVARISTPGFTLTGGTGWSGWTCEVCRPLITELVRKHAGDVEVHDKAKQ